MALTLEEFKKAIHPNAHNPPSWLIICRTRTRQIRVMGFSGSGNLYARPLANWPVEIQTWVLLSIRNGMTIESTDKVNTDSGLVTTLEFVNRAGAPLLRH